VWREWEDMDEATKEGLLETYQKKGLIPDDSKPPRKQETKDEKDRSKSKKKEAPAKLAAPSTAPQKAPLSQFTGLSKASVVAQAPKSQVEDSSDATPDILKEKKPGSESVRDSSLRSSEDSFKKKV